MKRFDRVNSAKFNNTTNAKIRNVTSFQRHNNVVVNNRANNRTRIVRHFNYGNNHSYALARRSFIRDRHDRRWWHNHYNRFVFYGGGYYYWNAGWWYPAYGYAPYSSFVYDGPIFGYNNYAPGDITVEVQQALAQQGYYNGQIDGILGPQTRGAIERFQAQNGLAVTATIDGETLASLGLA
ncbi:MAG: peptidoglycan-binding protein [Verrucomicrobiota bacterium]|nr:peptidoglycan-binding protein [Verrucomicrobiota bacterium]